jgi:GNAT superfamily N-acetyltransferase
MATIEAEPLPPYLPLVRRLEAAGFRAWPSDHVSYDGSWQLRITPGHPSKRLNCIVPLDPQDMRDMETRIEAAERNFQKSGVTASVRQSPLCPPMLGNVLHHAGWMAQHETLVMTADLDSLDLADGMDHLPSHDTQRFAEACIRIDEDRDTSVETISRIIGHIQPPAGLFLMDDAAGPKAVGICVHDNDLAGLQQVVVARNLRRTGLGLEIVTSALRWARLRGARQAWLQVIAQNHAARALYERLGFRTAYSYTYWQKASSDGGY